MDSSELRTLIRVVWALSLAGSTLYYMRTDKLYRQREIMRLQAIGVMVMIFLGVAFSCSIANNIAGTGEGISGTYVALLILALICTGAVAVWLWGRDYPQGSNQILLGSFLIGISAPAMLYGGYEYASFSEVPNGFPEELADAAVSIADTHVQKVIVFQGGRYGTRPYVTVYFPTVEAYQEKFEVINAQVLFKTDRRNVTATATESRSYSPDHDPDVVNIPVIPGLAVRLPRGLDDPRTWLDATASIEFSYSVLDESGVEQRKTQTMQRELRVYVANEEDYAAWSAKAESHDPISMSSVILLIGGCIVGSALIRWGWWRDHH